MSFLILLNASQHAELRGRVRNHDQRGSAADVIISPGSGGTACPSLSAGRIIYVPCCYCDDRTKSVMT